MRRRRQEPRDAVAVAVRSGRLIRGPCERCGTKEKVHGHHDDYNKPLAVRWLCRAHHLDVHYPDRRIKPKVTLNLPEDLWRRLRLRALYQSTTATKLVEQAIRQLLRTKPTDEPDPKEKRTA